MTETWWVVYRSRPTIESVEVSRSTDKSVWVSRGRGRLARGARSSDWRSYFRSFDEAKLHLVSERRRDLETAKRNLDYARNKLRDAEAQKPDLHSELDGVN